MHKDDDRTAIILSSNTRRSQIISTEQNTGADPREGHVPQKPQESSCTILQVYGHYGNIPFNRLALLGISPPNATTKRKLLSKRR